MEHALITTIAAGFGLALIFGFVAEKIGTPALVGYLLAGIAISPATPGYAGDMGIAAQLSEIGVMLLMFGVGLHFSISDLLSVRKIAVPGAIFQMLIATILGAVIASFWGWDLWASVVFGLSLSCASTVVLIKALEREKITTSMNGRIAVGWLVVEDLVTVLALVLLPVLSGLHDSSGSTQTNTSIALLIGKTFLQVGGFIAVMLILGKRIMPKLLWMIAKTGSRELFTLAVISAAIGIAFGAAELFNVSFALGAFFAGVVLRESELSKRAAKDSLPLQDAFSVLFFVAVGMLFQPSVIVEHPTAVLSVLFIIIIGKSIAAVALVLIFRYPLNSALTIAASLAQIGEFSFILAGLGLTLGLLPQLAFSLVLAGALISIAINPLIFKLMKPLRSWLLANSNKARLFDQRRDPLSELPMSTARNLLEGQVIVIGYGVIGRSIVAGLKERKIPLIIAEQNRDTVESLRAAGFAAVYGNAADPAVLIQAHIAEAAILVITANDPVEIQKMVETAKALNPDVRVLIDCENGADYAILTSAQLGTVYSADHLVSQAIVESVATYFNDRAAEGV